MTRAELRLQYNDLLAEITGKKTWLTAQADRWLNRSYKRKQRQYGLYLKTKATIITAGTAQYLQSAVLPVLASGEVQSKLHSVQFEQSSSLGSITAFADGGAGEVDITSSNHGLSVGDIVEIFGTTSYNGIFTVVTQADSNTFSITDTWVADDATGVWLESSLSRLTLANVPWQELQGIFSIAGQPTATEVPAGMAFLNWWVVGEDIASGELSDTKFPEPFQEHIAIDAVKNALISTGDKRLPAHIEAEWVINEKALAEWSEEMNPIENTFTGIYYGLNGLYAYRSQTERSFIIAPKVS